MWQRIIQRIAVGIVLWVCIGVSALAQSASFYTTNVPMVVSNAQPTGALFQAAWQQMVVRLSGRALAQLPVSVQAPKQETIESFIERYQMESNNGERWLQVVFVPSKVIRFLRHAEVPLWQTDRPTTLLWLMVASPTDDVSVLTADDARIQPASTLAHQRGSRSHRHPTLPVG